MVQGSREQGADHTRNVVVTHSLQSEEREVCMGLRLVKGSPNKHFNGHIIGVISSISTKKNIQI
jgi:hypothetical protein